MRVSNVDCVMATSSSRIERSADGTTFISRASASHSVRPTSASVRITATTILDCVGACVATSSGREWSSMRQAAPSGSGNESASRFEWYRGSGPRSSGNATAAGFWSGGATAGASAAPHEKRQQEDTRRSSAPSRLVRLSYGLTPSSATRGEMSRYRARPRRSVPGSSSSTGRPFPRPPCGCRSRERASPRRRCP